MPRSIATTAPTRKNLRVLLLCAVSSVVLAALTSAGHAVPFVCDDDTAHLNFACGSNALTTGSTSSTAVGDGPDAGNDQSGTAIGATAVAGSFSTAVGNFAFADATNATAIGQGAGSGVVGARAITRRQSGKPLQRTA